MCCLSFVQKYKITVCYTSVSIEVMVLCPVSVYFASCSKRVCLCKYSMLTTSLARFYGHKSIMFVLCVRERVETREENIPNSSFLHCLIRPQFTCTRFLFVFGHFYITNVMVTLVTIARRANIVNIVNFKHTNMFGITNKYLHYKFTF